MRGSRVSRYKINLPVSRCRSVTRESRETRRAGGIPRCKTSLTNINGRSRVPSYPQDPGMTFHKVTSSQDSEQREEIRGALIKYYISISPLASISLTCAPMAACLSWACLTIALNSGSSYRICKVGSIGRKLYHDRS